MTSQQINRVAQSLGDAKRLLARELAYRQDLQRADAVSAYRAEIERLEALLSDAWLAIKAGQSNTLARAAGKAKSRRFVVEQHSAFGAFAS